MAKKTLDQTMKGIIESIDDTVSVKRMRLLTKFTAKMIVDRTRHGFGAKSNRDKKLSYLKKLSKEYIEFRRRSILDSTTTPGRSNLTFSGQLLRSIKGQVTRKGVAVIKPFRKRNEEIAKYQEEQGRSFLYLPKTEREKLVKFYELTFSAILKNKGLR